MAQPRPRPRQCAACGNPTTATDPPWWHSREHGLCLACRKRSEFVAMADDHARQAAPAVVSTPPLAPRDATSPLPRDPPRPSRAAERSPVTPPDSRTPPTPTDGEPLPRRGEPHAPPTRAPAPAEPSPVPDDGPAVGPPSPSKPPVLVSLAEVAPRSIAWLWRGWIPAGMLSICDGLPGEGKSTMLVDIAARVTTGRGMPDGSPGVPVGGVLYLSFEDAAAELLQPRFAAAGADLSRVRVHNPEADDLFNLGKGCALESWIIEHQARLVIIDPLVSAVPSGVDMHKGQDARRVLGTLVRIAERTRAAIVGVRHFNKSEGRSALLRGEGSIGIGGTARAVFVVAKDPDDDAARVLARSKCNLGPPVPSRSFAIVPSPDDPEVGVVQWRGESRHGADDLTAPAQPEPRGALEEAIAFVRAELVDGAKPSAELEAAAEAAGHAKRTIKRARAQLGVTPERVGGRWIVALPQAADPAPKAGEP